MVKVGELDKLFFLNYFVGGLVIVLSIAGFFLDLFFKDLPYYYVYFNFSKGIGVIQIIVAIMFLLIIVGAFKFIQITWEYQRHYGL